MDEIKQTPIGIIKGEGIGPEIMDGALACLKEIERSKKKKFNFIFYEGPAPAESSPKEKAYPQLKNFYSKIRKQHGVILRSSFCASLVYKLREDFNQIYKLIYLEPLPELLGNSPLKKELVSRFDLLLIRENSQGIYHGQEKFEGTVEGERKYTINYEIKEKTIEDITEAAFKLANKRRKILHLFFKKSVLTKLWEVWLKKTQQMNKKFPEVSFHCCQPDNGLGELIVNPQKFDVVISLDVDGDIISDFLAGLIYGTRAITPSVNVDPISNCVSYQTIHGAGKGLANKDQANPLGMLMATALMLEHSFNMLHEARLIRESIQEVLKNGYRTGDIFEKGSSYQKKVASSEIIQLVIEQMRNFKEDNCYIPI